MFESDSGAGGKKINVDSFDDLTIVQDGANTVITTSASEADSVTLVNYDSTISPLTASDFHFLI